MSGRLQSHKFSDGPYGPNVHRRNVTLEPYPGLPYTLSVGQMSVLR